VPSGCRRASHVAVREWSQLCGVLNVFWKRDRDHPWTQCREQTGGCLLPRHVSVQNGVKELPPAEQVQSCRAEAGPTQRQARNPTLTQSRSIGPSTRQTLRPSRLA
jgi:hypothetical protein